MDFRDKGMGTMQKVLLIGGGVIVVVCIVAVVFFYNQYQSLKKNPNAEKDAETKDLVAQVGKHYELPTDETPTIATVSDKSKVTDQPFFAKAENGDKILIYRKNKLAILFRPKDSKLINVGPIDLDAAAGTTGGSASTSTAKVGLYNASSTAGLTTSAESKLASLGSAISVAEKKNANSKTLGKIVVVDVNGNQKDLSTKIAATLGGSVDSLPSGEAKPGVDIAVYIGK